MITNDNSIFAKAGVETTGANGTFNVVFRYPFEYGLDYCPVLVCEYPGVAVIAYPSNISQTGFTITTRSTTVGGGGPTLIGSVIVHWVAMPHFN